jgi:hypothetical protein
LLEDENDETNRKNILSDLLFILDSCIPISVMQEDKDYPEPFLENNNQLCEVFSETHSLELA